MAGAADIPAFRSMRTLRALRPLRAVSRWEGMRVSSCRALALRSRPADVVCRCNFETPLVLLLTCDQLCQTEKKSFPNFLISCARVTWTRDDSLSYNFPLWSKSYFLGYSPRETLSASLPGANFFLPLLWTLNVQQFVLHSLSICLLELKGDLWRYASALILLGWILQQNRGELSSTRDERSFFKISLFSSLFLSPPVLLRPCLVNTPR